MAASVTSVSLTAKMEDLTVEEKVESSAEEEAENSAEDEAESSAEDEYESESSAEDEQSLAESERQERRVEGTGGAPDTKMVMGAVAVTLPPNNSFTKLLTSSVSTSGNRM